ncbi:MAG: LysR family transcriptional regulator [Burkholderiales bacterium]
MDLRDIEYFSVIAEHGHLGRAAEALGLGQPALSISLRRLEQAAEAKLVKRTPKGVELTAVGTALLSHVRRLQLARDDLAREVADLAHGRAGHLRIGASSGNAEAVLPEVCSALLADAPKLEIDVVVRDNEALLPALRKGELDLVVAHIEPHPLPGLHQEAAGQDEFIMYCSARNPFAGRRRLKLADLANQRWVSTPASATTSWLSLKRTFAEHGLPQPQFALLSESVAVRLRAVAASSDLLGIGSKRTVQRHARQMGLVIMPVQDLGWVRPVAVAYRQDAYLSPAAKRFIEILKKTAKEIAMQP